MISFLTVITALWAALLVQAPSTGSTPLATSDQLAAAVEAVGSGRISFSYPTRPGVRGNGRSLEFQTGSSSHHQFYSGSWPHDQDLQEGPARVVLDLEDGRITDLDLQVGFREKAGKVDRDLGPVDSAAAAAYFLDRAPILDQEVDEDLTENLLLAAVIARDADLAAPLLELTGNRHHGSRLRSTAMFWAASLAADKIMGPLNEIIDQPDEDMELREHAVFALGQVESPETLPRLLRIARNGREPHLQRMAFFVLADRDEPEIQQLFEDILLEK